MHYSKNKNALRWRAYFGFGPSDFFVVEEEDYERVKYAMITGKIVDLGGSTIRGNIIQRLEKDIRNYTGWVDTYSPTDNDDAKQIERDVPIARLQRREALGDERVRFIVEHGKQALLTELGKVDELMGGVTPVKAIGENHG